jgi:hypothetical protein
MNRNTSAWATALAFVSLAFVAGCNGAQFNEAPSADAGPLCSTLAPIITCDAGGPASPNSCTAEPTSSDVVVARIPPGNYPAGCRVQFYFGGFGGGCLAAHYPCTCLADDAGAQWGACADAGTSGVSQ